MATHSSILAWRIPWTEEHGGLLFIRLHRAGHYTPLDCKLPEFTGQRSYTSFYALHLATEDSQQVTY